VAARTSRILSWSAAAILGRLSYTTDCKCCEVLWDTLYMNHLSAAVAIEKVVWSGNISGLYSEGDPFESWPRHQLPYWVSLQENARIVLKLGHDCFLPNPFQFIIHRWPYHSKLYSVVTEDVAKQTVPNHAVAQPQIKEPILEHFPLYSILKLCLTNRALRHEGMWRSSCVASRPCRFTPEGRAPGTHWVDPRAGLDDVEKRKFLILPGL
jgi:hypothetical protein